MDLGLRGKGVIVTGASRGIGRATALAFAAEGASLALCARGTEELDATAEALRGGGARVVAAPCDVADPAALAAFLDRAHAELGRVDVLVNNASAMVAGDTPGDWRRALDVDLLASVNASRQVAPWIHAQGGGAILHVSSTLGGFEADLGPIAYATVKGALVAHSKMLAVKLAPQAIRVNCIAPGAIEFAGGLWDQVRQRQPERYQAMCETIPLGRLGSAEEVARAIVFLASDAASWISGVALAVDGCQHKGNY
ncbi:MAG: SDR family NAD(P)-dependent oxidoreductase [Myxococcota bacterium]